MPTVIIYWSPGRSEEQKADVIHELTETLVEKGGARREDVLIIFQEIQPGDAGRGGRVIGAPFTADGAKQADNESL
jgi:4-oxalocrotonate tautomerase family enzyme